MLRDIDKTLEKFLYERGNISRQDVDISFDQPTGEWSARLNQPTLNCWAFDIRDNMTLRVSGMRVDRKENSAQKSFPARRMDIYYLISSWATEVEDEHRLLWRALSTLKRMPFWRPADCIDDLRYQTRNIPIMVADMEDVPFNLTDLWGVLENQMKLGFILRVTVELELDILSEPPLVLTSRVTVGQREDHTKREIQVRDDEIVIEQKETEEQNEDDG